MQPIAGTVKELQALVQVFQAEVLPAVADRLFNFLVQHNDLFLCHTIAVILYKELNIVFIQEGSHEFNFIVRPVGVKPVDEIIFYQELEDIPYDSVIEQGGIKVIAEADEIPVSCDKKGQVLLAEGQFLPEGYEGFCSDEAAENGGQVGNQPRCLGIPVAVALIAQHFQGIV